MDGEVSRIGGRDLPVNHTDLCTIADSFPCHYKGGYLIRPGTAELEKRLEQFPSQLDAKKVLFLSHSFQGLEAECYGEWQSAVKHYDTCYQQLTEVDGLLSQDLHLWLLLWVSIPLKTFYHFMFKDYATAIEITDNLLLRWNSESDPNFEQGAFCKNAVSIGRNLVLLEQGYDLRDRDLEQSLAQEYIAEAMKEVQDEDEDTRAYYLGLNCLFLQLQHLACGNYGDALRWMTERSRAMANVPFEIKVMYQPADIELLLVLGEIDVAIKRLRKLKQQLEDDYPSEKAEHEWVCKNGQVIFVELNGVKWMKIGGQKWMWKDVRRLLLARVNDLLSVCLELKVDLSSSDKSVCFFDLKASSSGKSKELWEIQEWKVCLRSLRDPLQSGDSSMGSVNELECNQDSINQSLFPVGLGQHYWGELSLMETGLAQGLEFFIRGIRDEAQVCFENALTSMENSTSLPKSLLLQHRVTCLKALGKLVPSTFGRCNKEDLKDLELAADYFCRCRDECIRLGEWRQIADINFLLGKNHFVDATKSFIGAAESVCELPGDYHGSILMIKDPYKGLVESLERSIDLLRSAVDMHSIMLYGLKAFRVSFIINLETFKEMFLLLQKALFMQINPDTGIRKCSRELNIAASQESAVREVTKLQEALLWAERGRSRTLLHQLPGCLSGQATKHLLDFAWKDEVAWNAIKRSVCTCGKGAHFVEYSYDCLRNSSLIYVINDAGDLWLREMAFEAERVDDMVKAIHSCMSNENLEEYEESKRKVSEVLKCLYVLLIDPIADLLKHMDPEHKLIISANEILSEVPFPILQRPADGSYLIQHHTISVTPSLRVLSLCNQRLLALHASPLSPDAGAGVAVGDPAYRLSKQRLEGTKEEVDSIASIFKDKGVVNLQGNSATVKAILDWAERPLEGDCCHGFIHLAVHGHVNVNNHNGGLEFAYQRASNRASTSSSIRGSADARSPFLSQRREIHTTDSAVRTVKAPSDLDFEIDSHLESDTRVDFDEKAQAEEFDKGLEKEETNSEISVILKDALEIELGEDLEEEVAAGFTRPVATQAFGEVGGVAVKRGPSGKKSCLMKTNGMLTSDDIIDCGFEWRTHMVVLSACDSAKGTVLSEGVLNLPRAFMTVGVPTIVASQWRVHDKSAPELMKEFYTSLRAGNDVASALRFSMLQMLEKGNEVYKWGAFIVWGLPTVCLPEGLQISKCH